MAKANHKTTRSARAIVVAGKSTPPYSDPACTALAKLCEAHSMVCDDKSPIPQTVREEWQRVVEARRAEFTATPPTTAEGLMALLVMLKGMTEWDALSEDGKLLVSAEWLAHIGPVVNGALRNAIVYLMANGISLPPAAADWFITGEERDWMKAEAAFLKAAGKRGERLAA